MKNEALHEVGDTTKDERFIFHGLALKSRATRGQADLALFLATLRPCGFAFFKKDENF